ncbi:unnamed protein product, partial [marine sediment metagenome]
DESAYGVDLLVQQFTQSDAWDALRGSTAGGASAQLNPVETAWVQASSSPVVAGVVPTTDNMWAEVARVTVPDQSAYDVAVAIDGKRTDAFGFSSGWYSALAQRDGVVTIQTSTLYDHMSGGADFRFVADGADLVMEVKGVISQDWSWSMTSFTKEIV